jgi:sugar diacid utilization regulator
VKGLVPVEVGSTAGDSLGPLASLIHLAVDSDDSERLAAAASDTLARPVAVVGPAGDRVASLPDGPEGQRALTVARAAARNGLVAAPAWEIVALEHGGALLGHLVIGANGDDDAVQRTVCELLPSLLAGQLQRAAQLRAQRSAFVRRLASDTRFTAAQARRDAADLGVTLADAYWPALLAWQRAVPRGSVVETVERELRERTPDSLVASLDGRMLLLYPGGAARDEAGSWLGDVVALARALAPASRARVIAKDAAVSLTGLGAAMEELETFRRFGTRAGDERSLLWSRQFGLERLLREHVGAAGARRFVDDQLGPLVAWDREHRSGLLTVLEAALDHPRHDHAARRCFMHRNTFRHRLRQALAVLGDPLEDPESRLAVHVALKLRRLAAAEPPRPHPARPAGAPRRDGRA